MRGVGEPLGGVPSCCARKLDQIDRLPGSEAENEAHAAFYVNNEPEDSETPKLVQAGFIVRTRADADLKEAIENDTSRRDKAFASGAQIITTDFPSGEAHMDTGYVVKFDGDLVARVNPVALPAAPTPGRGAGRRPRTALVGVAASAPAPSAYRCAQHQS